MFAAGRSASTAIRHGNRVVAESAAERRAVEADIDREQQVLARCRAQEPGPAVAQELLDIVAEGAGRSGRARVGLINRAVDLAITPTAMKRNGAWRTIGALRRDAAKSSR